MEVHPWEAGYDATQSMMEKLHADGFVVDRQISQKDDVLVFNRPTLLA
jgi:hypothetical protein